MFSLLLCIITIVICSTREGSEAGQAGLAMMHRESEATTILHLMEGSDRPWSTALKAKVTGLGVSALTNAYILSLTGYHVFWSSEDSDLSSVVVGSVIGTSGALACTAVAISKPQQFQAMARLSAAYLVIKMALLYLAFEWMKTDMNSSIRVTLGLAIFETGSAFAVGTLLELGKMLWHVVVKGFN